MYFCVVELFELRGTRGIPIITDISNVYFSLYSLSRSTVFSRNAGTKRTTAMRRQDENSELTELSAILPMVRNSSSVDKISVVRLTTAYLKFRMFLHEGTCSAPCRH